MAAVAPIASIGLGMVSQMGQAAAQQKQINSQAKALEQQNMIAQDRLALDTHQLEQQKASAEFLANRETTLNDAQINQARLAQTEAEQRQQLMYTGMNAQINQQDAQNKNAVNAFLGQNAGETSQIHTQNAAQMEALASALEQSTGVSKDIISKFIGLTGGNATNVSSQDATKQNLAMNGIEQYQRGVSNSNAAERTAQYSANNAQSSAAFQEQTAQLASQLNRSNLAFQKQADSLGNTLANSDITYTGLRNDAGIQAQKYAAMGAASLAQTNALFDNQNRSVQYQAQLSSLNSQRPGLLSMANTLGQGFNALNQLGIFGNPYSHSNSTPPGYSVRTDVTLPTFQPQAQPTIDYYGSNVQKFDSNATSFSGTFG